MNHIKTMLCGHFIGIDKLERLKLLQNDPSSTSLIKGLASADACAEASRCGSPIKTQSFKRLVALSASAVSEERAYDDFRSGD